MNQTGGEMKRGAAPAGGQTMMQRTGMEAAGAQMEYNPYAEEPRPNLYNIVKNTKENKPGYMRLLYVAKISESEMKGDVENSMINHFKHLAEE
jgi:hypothetical protein